MQTSFKSQMTSRAAEKKATVRAKLTAWQLARRLVLERDGYRCRACQSKDSVDVHHMKFRSLGGKDDDPKALLCLCRCCHGDVHLYKLAITGGRRVANGTLSFERT